MTDDHCDLSIGSEAALNFLLGLAPQSLTAPR